MRAGEVSDEVRRYSRGGSTHGGATRGGAARGGAAEATAEAPAVAGADSVGISNLAAADDSAGGGEVEPEIEATYGLCVDSVLAFDIARETVQRLHKAFVRLQNCKVASIEGDPAPDSAFVEASRDIQLNFLALRRAHRAMARAAEAGRVAEASARKVADAAFSELEASRQESACCRAASRLCRACPTPQLNKLRPSLQGAAGAVEADFGFDVTEPAENARGGASLLQGSSRSASRRSALSACDWRMSCRS